MTSSMLYGLQKIAKEAKEGGGVFNKEFAQKYWPYALGGAALIGGGAYGVKRFLKSRDKWAPGQREKLVKILAKKLKEARSTR